MLWVLTVVCFQFMGDYWLRHVRPDYTREFAKAIDAGIKSLFQTCVGVNISSWSAIAMERMRLPINLKGCGLRESVDRRHAQFIGGLLQSALPLMNRTDSKNCLIEGRLNIPCIIDLFGEGAFDYPFTSPWEKLLTESSPSNNLANGLQFAWSHLKYQFQDVATHEQHTDVKLLLSQDVNRAGFYADGI